MIHEKMFKRENGDKVTIILSADSGTFSAAFRFKVSITVTPKGKRKPTINTRAVGGGENICGWKWRTIPMEERSELMMKFILGYVTMEEIEEVRSELIEKMKNIPIEATCY